MTTEHARSQKTSSNLLPFVRLFLLRILLLLSKHLVSIFKRIWCLRNWISSRAVSILYYILSPGLFLVYHKPGFNIAISCTYGRHKPAYRTLMPYLMLLLTRVKRKKRIDVYSLLPLYPLVSNSFIFVREILYVWNGGGLEMFVPSKSLYTLCLSSYL